MATATVLAPAKNTRATARFAWVTLGFFLFVVLWGAVVRATGSGGGCGSNWPLCNGDFVPHHPRLATIIEFTHRSTSGICTALLVILGVFTFRVTPPGHRARKAVLWAAFLLVTEALLGAMLVLRHWVEGNISTGRDIAQCIHLTNTMLFMAALALTAFYLTPDTHPIAGPRSGRPAAIISIVATLFIAATGSLAALADTLFPSPSLTAALAADMSSASPILVRMRWMHPAAALIGTACVLLMLRTTGLRTPLARIVVALLGAQFVLGIADVLLLAPIWMQVLHLLGADLYWIALILLAAKIVWPTRQIPLAT
ncbi:cytochrome c oxidase assembly protein subunit 15 [Granulicella aggregans]|uniref:Cytochrome c oxidase assembly protein subunit 15 n=1 Tax=Granulicella aggregans TaxID=474949 RepID=A0A7W8E5E2_9BACT|nr:COX15/CtaA family protein [Granulicella aggregans]MBB5059988.1 cytochrome c oxidase assembly protein subunit 15 [Granulicella aggregans]